MTSVLWLLLTPSQLIECTCTNGEHIHVNGTVSHVRKQRNTQSYVASMKQSWHSVSHYICTGPNGSEPAETLRG